MGSLIGQDHRGPESISFQAMKQKLAQLQQIVETDPAVATVIGFTGTRALNNANVFVGLKPSHRGILSADQVVQRLRPKPQPGLRGPICFLQAVQDPRIGGRQSAAEYQYTLTSDDTGGLYTWTPKLVAELDKYRAEIVDVNSDLQQNGLQTYVTINRATARCQLQLCAEPDR